jgi:hypothetical protein
MRNIQPFLIGCLALATLSADVRAQSLADVAKAEEARRKTVKVTSKTYTNDDLKGGGSETGAPAPETPPPAEAVAKPDQQKPVAPDQTKTEKYWKDRVAAIQQQLARNKVLLDALLSRVNALNADFVTTDDPAQRAVIQGNITTAQAETQRVQRDTEKQTKAAADLQDEARKANVPPGWLR